MADKGINLNGTTITPSYADVIKGILESIADIEEVIENLPDFSTVVRTTDTQYKTLVSDDETHNKNWEALIGDIQELGD